MGTRAAFERFKQEEPTTPQLIYREGGYLATVVDLAGSWAWIVWNDDGGIVGSARSFTMDAATACRDALDCIAASKARPGADSFSTTEL